MAPGIWGRPSSTLDWCEENYAVTPYIAEFWNTVSNVLMIIPPLITIFLLLKQGFEKRFVACHFSLLCVGIGSWCFHMTLLYSMQLLDELPMIWGSAFLVYAFCEVKTPPNKHNLPLQVVLFSYCFIVTVVYIYNKNSVFFQISYGIMVVSLVTIAVNTVRQLERTNKALLVAATVTYGTGFILWNIDNEYCQSLQIVRRIAGVLSPVLELHAWWHILAGLGTYLSLIFIAHTRCVVLEQKSRIKYWLNFWPYLALESKFL